MRFKNLYGNSINLSNPRKYLIDWDAKSRSKFQFAVKQFLKPYWEHDMVFEELKLVGSRMSLDIYNANKKVAVEVQGRQHTAYVKFFHGDRLNYLGQLKRDEKKFKFCQLNDIILVEIYPEDTVDESLFEKLGVIL